MRTKTCLKCGKGYNLLVCRSSTCVVTIHESCCVPGSLQVHDRDNFVCPYCLYKQSVAECCQAKNKALSAERNLALFLGAKEHEPNTATDKEHSNQRKNKERVQFQQAETHTNKDESGLVHMRGMLSNEQASPSNKEHGNQRKNKERVQFQQAETHTNKDESGLVHMRGMLSNEQASPSNKEHGNQRKNKERVQFQQAETHTNKDESGLVHMRGMLSNEQASPSNKEHGNQRKNKERVQFQQAEAHPNKDESGLVHMRGMLSNEQASPSTFGKRGGFLRKCKQIRSMTQMEKQKNRDGQFSDSLHSRWEGVVLVAEPVSYCEERIAGKKTEELVRKSKRQREAYETSICSISEGYDRTEGYSKLARLSIVNAIEFKNYSPGEASGSDVDECNDPNTAINDTAGWIEKPSKQILDGVSYPRRKRVRWTTEEEEMLEKGVLVFSSSVNKNIPWRKILTFGSNVFHQWRTPLDLQSKWKIMSRKQQS